MRVPKIVCREILSHTPTNTDAPSEKIYKLLHIVNCPHKFYKKCEVEGPSTSNVIKTRSPTTATVPCETGEELGS